MDCTQIMKDVDSFCERIDEVYKRKNVDPAYTAQKALEDAISDSVRYFGNDRKEEVAEILFSILDKIYRNILSQNTDSSFCNPQVEKGDAPRLPQMDMFMRSLMPLSWALSGQWEIPELKDTIDEYLLLYSEPEALLVYEIFDFLFKTFPEFAGTPQQKDFMDYWRKMAHSRGELTPEDDNAKSILLGYLMEKRSSILKKKCDSGSNK